MRGFARVQLKDAERGCHKIFDKEGLLADVKVDYLVDLGEHKTLKQFPFVKMSSWVKYLLQTDRLHRQLVGAPSWACMQKILASFWERFKVQYPTHFVFGLFDDGCMLPSCTIPLMSHSDEGRSFKHNPLFILSTAGALGRGTRSYLKEGKHRAPLKRNQMGMNFVGKSWATQFMQFSLLRLVKDQEPEVFNQLIQMYGRDMQLLWEKGIWSEDGQRHVWCIHLYTKGDLPALKVMGGLKRSFSNVPRGPASKKACTGVCHLCLAGQERDDARSALAHPYEDLGQGASWTTTQGAVLPWEETPLVLKDMPVMDQKLMVQFFATDLWHNFHLGIGKHFTASAFVAIVESDLACLPRGKVELKFEFLTSEYKAYFRKVGISPYVPDISRESMSFPASTASPVGRWSKGAATSQFMLFLAEFSKLHIYGKTSDPLLLDIAPCLCYL